METDPFKHGRIPKAFAADFFDGKVHHVKWSEKESEVLKFCVEKIKAFSGIVFAHNGGKFDFTGFIIRHIKEDIFGEDARLIGSRLVSLKVGNCELRDSYAILPSPLKSYDKGEISYEKFEKGTRQKYKEEIIAYLKRDCESLFLLVEKFQLIHGQSVLTAASAGMKFMKSLGYQTKSFNESKDEKFRKWYYGGRCQPFKTGIFEKTLELYDIKSAYPFAMVHNHSHGESFDFIAAPKKIEDSDFVCFRGRSEGCFPFREKSGLSFTPSTSEFYITGWEYNVAKKNSLVKGEVLFVERPSKIESFEKYVNHFFAEKERAEKEGDKAGRLIAKIMLNAVYGKYAQRPDNYRDFMYMPINADINEFNMYFDGEWEEEYVDEENGFAVWSTKSRKPPTYYNVSTAASITGFVRAMLIDVCSRCIPYYCDTDSILCEPTSKLVKGNGLGSWQLETVCDLAAIAGKKLYALRIIKDYCSDEKTAKEKGYYWWKGRGWKMATKGVRLTPEEVISICQGKEVLYKNAAPTYGVHKKPYFVQRKIKRTA